MRKQKRPRQEETCQHPLAPWGGPLRARDLLAGTREGKVVIHPGSGPASPHGQLLLQVGPLPVTADPQDEVQLLGQGS